MEELIDVGAGAKMFVKIRVFRDNDERVPKKLRKDVNREEIPNEKTQRIGNLLYRMSQSTHIATTALRKRPALEMVRERLTGTQTTTSRTLNPRVYLLLNTCFCTTDAWLGATLWRYSYYYHVDSLMLPYDIKAKLCLTYLLANLHVPNTNRTCRAGDSSLSASIMPLNVEHA
jgi:hypothetical protein